MSGIRLYVVFWLLSVITIHYGLCCGPAEIGQQYTIKSTVSSGSSVQWELDGGVIVYDSLSPSPNRYPDLYVGTRTQLTIKTVTKNDTTTVFKHLVDNVLVYTCTLPVYKRPSTTICEAVTLTGNRIRKKCTIGEVFPQAKCQFTLQNGGTDTKDIADGASYITYTHTDPQSGGNEYYSTSCTLQYPVDGLKPGNWIVRVNMYPDLTGVSLAQGTIGQADDTLQLSVPTVNIDPNNCPKGLAGEGDANVRQGYIRQGERASCLCTRTYAGNPPGTIGWSSTQGRNFDMLSQSEDGATIQINSPENFTCRSISVLDGSHSVTYTPKYAYGPSSASLTFQPPGPIYLCPNQQTNIDITCQVPANSFSPVTLFTIRLDNSNNLAPKVAGDDAWYKSVSYNFTRPGQHTFTCHTENAIFRDIFSEAPASAIEVYEPPKNLPKIYARSSQNGNIVVEGDDVFVTCEVSGEYPSLQSVTLTCGQDQSVTSNGMSAALILNKIGLSYNDTNCTCQATHITGCYDMNGVISLIVLMYNQTKLEEILPDITKAQLAGVIVGSIVGMLVLAAVIVLMVLYIRRKKAQRKSRITEYDHIEITHDQNVRPDDQNYLGIIPSENSPDLARESVVQETENTENAEACSDYIELDVNAYSEIHERAENANEETEKPNKNEKSGDYLEPKEPDSHPHNDVIEREESVIQETDNINTNDEFGQYITPVVSDPSPYSDVNEREESVSQEIDNINTNDEFGQYITPVVSDPSPNSDVNEREESAIQDENDADRNQPSGDYIELEDSDPSVYNSI